MVIIKVNEFDLRNVVNLETVSMDLILTIAMEECSELIQAISKNKRGKGNYDNTCEEVVDVLICIEWLIERLNLKQEDILRWLDFKINRCNIKIKSGEFK